LRQNLSKYLTRVKEGESLRVTERGKEVGRLVPSGEISDGYAWLAIRFGATIPTRRIGDVVAEMRDRPRSPSGTADAILAKGRRERI